MRTFLPIFGIESETVLFIKGIFSRLLSEFGLRKKIRATSGHKLRG
jgi:hypothetical protein